MLDVISGAMAAFLIIMIVLLPYYTKDHIDYQAIIDSLQQQLQQANAQADEVQRQLAQVQDQLNEMQGQLNRAQAENQELARRLAKTFLVLYIRWNTRDDVDLHVIDPSGAKFSFQRKTIPGRPGELSEDATVGPANEVWEIRDAPPGEYRVEVELYSSNGGDNPTVDGRVFHRDGSEAFRQIRLTQERQPLSLARITVAADGAVSVR